MAMLLAFMPFVVFAVVERLTSPLPGLAAAALAAAALVLRDAAAPHRAPKILEIGTVLLFTGLTFYTWLGNPGWSVIGVRLWVDAGLLAIVLLSIALRRPFTLQYAREQVPEALWDTPEFIRTNYVITAIWSLAFAVIVLAEWAIVHTSIPQKLGIIAVIAALIGAVRFTGWYPRHIRRRAAA
ncbi:MAG TPA: hypothetical protein VE690_14995 [Rhodopila sp.]|nr:hypothetical protein [Rhodopila sp.]